MELITNNPYRQLGLLVGATAKQESNHKTKINQYLDADHEIPSQYIEYGFNYFGEIQRTTQSISTAGANLTLGEDRVNAALFWFWNGNPITDEPAFDALKEGDIDTALQIWENLITGTKEDGKKSWKQITEKNYSAFHNFFVINMICQNGNINNGIVANLRFIENDLITRFTQIVAGETYKSSKKELQLFFLNQLLHQQDLKLNKLLRIFNNNTFSGKADFYKIITQKLTEPIEHKIEVAKTKRKSNNESAYQAGQELYDTTINDFEQLKSSLESDNIIYSSLADKLANEILQCAIEYFNASNKENSSCFEPTLKLAKFAEAIAVGKIVRSRIRENIDNLEMMRFPEINDAIKVLIVIKNAYDEMLYNFDWRRSINENKVNEMLKDVFTSKAINKMLTCDNLILLESFISHLASVLALSDNYNWLVSDSKTLIILNSLPANSNARVKMEERLKIIQKERKEKNSVIIAEVITITVLSLIGLIVGLLVENEIGNYSDTNYWLGCGLTGLGLGLLILTIIEWNRDNLNSNLLWFIGILSTILTIIGLIYSIWGIETLVNTATTIGGIILFIVFISIFGRKSRD